MRVLVCLPTRNEIESIELMIDKIKTLNLDLIISDQNSNDGTIEKSNVKNIPVYQRDGDGKGWGVRKALAVAKEKGYDALVMIDCDYTYQPEQIPKLLDFISENEMVVGIRNMKDIQFSHRLVNIFHSQFINFLFGVKLKDINSGLRVINVDKFIDMLDAEGFDIEAQITAVALKKKFRIKEVCIDYKRRLGKSKIKPMDTFRIIKRIIKERFR